MRNPLRSLLSLALGICSAAPSPAQQPKFFPDDPLLIDDDRTDVADAPREIALSDLFDRFGHTLADLGSRELTEAQNVNTLDEVPDSSWFTNRHGTTRLSLDDLRRGPNNGDGPDMAVPWRVVRSKVGGLTPGFHIIDGRGDRYVIKLDPLGIPELSSAAEIIGTKLFHAIGYNTPENYIVEVDPEKGLAIEPGTKIQDEFGDESPLTRNFLRRMLRRVPRLPDGRIRVTATKFLPGRPLGPFRYYGTRTDDPNDIILHENRRELRGLRVFAAWTNHDDTRAHNTQDSWVASGGRRFIRHYLLDFGSTFGSGSVENQLPNFSFHYWLDLDEVKKNLRGFGLRTPKHRKVKWPPFPKYSAVGLWESESYEPHAWRNDYPNPAFVRMTERDAFWAAKIIMRFTPEDLRAIVETGRYSDPEVAEYFWKVLVERQRKTARYYLNRMNPISEFAVVGDSLEFANLSERHGFAEPGAKYLVSWSIYDNDADCLEQLERQSEHSATRIPMPATTAAPVGSNRFLRAELRTLHNGHPLWNRKVDIYLRPTNNGFEVVGIERESDPPSIGM